MISWHDSGNAYYEGHFLGKVGSVSLKGKLCYFFFKSETRPKLNFTKLRLATLRETVEQERRRLGL